MAFSPIANTVKVVMDYSWGTSGKVLANVFHVQPQTFLIDYTGQITTTTADNWFNSWTSHLMALLSTELSLVSCTITDAGSEFGPQAISDIAPAAGEQSGTPLPSSVAALVSLYSSHRSRTGRGRIYLPGVPSSQLNPDGTLFSTFMANLVSAVNSFNVDIGGVGATGFQLAVGSRKDAVSYQVQSVLTNSSVARSQDRRELNRA
jgi:hypothetical protein